MLQMEYFDQLNVFLSNEMKKINFTVLCSVQDMSVILSKSFKLWISKHKHLFTILKILVLDLVQNYAKSV